MNINSFNSTKSEETQELLSTAPSWILRWGNSIIFLCVSILIFCTWLIHYPDLVKASFRLTSENAPKTIVSRTQGKIVKLLVKDRSQVKAGDMIAYMESTADHKEVVKLSYVLHESLKNIHSSNLENLNSSKLFSFTQLGELQLTYQNLVQAHIRLRAYLGNGFYIKKIAYLSKEVSNLQDLLNNLKIQHSLLSQDVNLSKEDFEIQKMLAKDKVISPLDLKREESKAILKKMPYYQLSMEIINNISSQRAKKEEIAELIKQIGEERDIFIQSMYTLQTAVEEWKRKYLISAPINGKIIYVSNLQENQTISFEQELFYISPFTVKYFGELFIQQQNMGKVHNGQQVLIKFAGYPHQEYGTVRGRVYAISDVPLNDSVFLAKVFLPKGLETNYGKKLIYRSGMRAYADIVTTDRRLIEKIFYKVRSVSNGNNLQIER